MKAGLLLILSSMALAGAARGAPVSYVTGLMNPEDIVAIPGRARLIASGLAAAGEKSGKLYLIDAARHRVAELRPRVGVPSAEFAACPGPLDLTGFRPHGIALGRFEHGQGLLYVVNHGGRESIEVFAVDASDALIWRGCVELPAGTSGNGVAALPDGGFVATKFFDTHQGDWIAQLTRLAKTGAVYAWHPGRGFTELAAAGASGDNGIEVSPDGRWVYVNIWPEKRILKLALDGGSPPVEIPIDFMPDNIHFAPDGTLLIGGHISDIRTLMSCKRARCPVDWALARLDPRTLHIEYLLWEKGTAEFEGVTGAAEVDGQLWLSTFRGDRVGVIALPTPALK